MFKIPEGIAVRKGIDLLISFASQTKSNFSFQTYRDVYGDSQCRGISLVYTEWLPKPLGPTILSHWS